ncbi:MAG TPA: thioredoxin-disulfide reductase, partial [bacterium]|nr:thioredoxin-disulfide reductase [bacterium]
KRVVKTKDREYKASAIIVASGTQPRKLGILGEDRLLGKGVSYCATCDGPLFKGQDIVVVGGGDSAVEEVLSLTKFAKKVTLIHRRERLRATRILQERALANEKIEFVWDSVVTEILGKEGVDGIRVKNKKTEEEKEIPCTGVFVSIGIVPATKFLRGLVDMDKEGYIPTDENMKTSVDGVYACGDCRKKLLRQIITACGEGALAAFAATKYVEELKGMAYPGNSDR